nr:transmembrane protein 11, mitochondrial isoform X1 [Vicugna pacos]
MCPCASPLTAAVGREPGRTLHRLQRGGQRELEGLGEHQVGLRWDLPTDVVPRWSSLSSAGVSRGIFLLGLFCHCTQSGRSAGQGRPGPLGRFGFWQELSEIPTSGLTVSRTHRVSLSATDCYIVHEIYNGENAQDQFEYELEQALEAQYKYIVIEPTRIGDETARWITVGNCLHKTTVLAGTACLFTPLALPLDYSHYISLPAGVLSLACCTLYGISWQFDPCCKYQVEYDAYKLSRLPLHTLTSSTPVVLVRKDDLHRKRLHNTIALAALVYCVKKIYELCAV